MNTPTPTPRTDAEITFTGAYTHTCGELSCDECNARTATLTAERDQLRAELERTDAIYQRACEIEHQLRAEVERLTNHSSALEKPWRFLARADRADADLAVERARLDAGTILLTVAGERVWHCGLDLRAAIDAGIKEGAK